MRRIHCWPLAWRSGPLASRPGLGRGPCMLTLCRVPMSKNSSCLRLWRVARSAAAAALRRRWPRWRTRKKETTQACWLQDELLWNLLDHKRLRNPMKKHKDLSYRNSNQAAFPGTSLAATVRWQEPQAWPFKRATWLPSAARFAKSGCASKRGHDAREVRRRLSGAEKAAASTASGNQSSLIIPMCEANLPTESTATTRPWRLHSFHGFSKWKMAVFEIGN